MSKLALKPETVKWVINHVVMHGDTDIFPYPFENIFFSEEQDKIVEYICSLNLGQYRPQSLFETIAPKSKWGFRVVHQLYPIDTLVLTSAVASIGRKLEAARLPKEDDSAYSYRFQPDPEFNFFARDHSFRNWLQSQHVRTVFGDEIHTVIEADIADFYQRIYSHRLQNVLDQHSSNPPLSKFIIEFLKDLRVRQSFGLPVGSNASRILAEILINDIDLALKNEGYEFTRYVDDFRIFLKRDQHPYPALAFLAEQLAMNEGLSLSVPKTRILSREEFLDHIADLSGEDHEQTNQSATELLFWRVYETEEIDQQALESLLEKDLTSELSEEVCREIWDLQKIRVLLRALRLTKNRGVVAYIRQNIGSLIMFVKEIVLLIDELKKSGEDAFDDLGETIIDIILSPTGNSLPLVRVWLLELFVRGSVPITFEQLRRLDVLRGTLDLRQLYLLRGRMRDVNYFRRGKTRISELNVWLQPAFMYGASCLPPDEFGTWIGNIKGRINFPASDQFCQWVKKKNLAY